MLLCWWLHSRQDQPCFSTCSNTGQSQPTHKNMQAAMHSTNLSSTPASVSRFELPLRSCSRQAPNEPHATQAAVLRWPAQQILDVSDCVRTSGSCSAGRYGASRHSVCHTATLIPLAQLDWLASLAPSQAWGLLGPACAMLSRLQMSCAVKSACLPELHTDVERRAQRKREAVSPVLVARPLHSSGCMCDCVVAHGSKAGSFSLQVAAASSRKVSRTIGSTRPRQACR